MAITIMERRGWTQHRFNDDLDRVCAAEALRMANEQTWSYNVMLCNRVLIARGETPNHLTGYNDVEGRTPDEMIELLKMAADYQQEREEMF
jgi:hypothetical protein